MQSAFGGELRLAIVLSQIFYKSLTINSLNDMINHWHGLSSVEIESQKQLRNPYAKLCNYILDHRDHRGSSGIHRDCGSGSGNRQDPFLRISRPLRGFARGGPSSSGVKAGVVTLDGISPAKRERFGIVIPKRCGHLDCRMFSL